MKTGHKKLNLNKPYLNANLLYKPNFKVLGHGVTLFGAVVIKWEAFQYLAHHVHAHHKLAVDFKITVNQSVFNLGPVSKRI